MSPPPPASWDSIIRSDLDDGVYRDDKNLRGGVRFHASIDPTSTAQEARRSTRSSTQAGAKELPATKHSAPAAPDEAAASHRHGPVAV